jgi:hypothetical protein
VLGQHFREFQGGVVPDGSVEAGVPRRPDPLTLQDPLVVALDLVGNVAPMQRSAVEIGHRHPLRRGVADGEGQHDGVGLGGVAVGAGGDGARAAALKIDPADVSGAKSADRAIVGHAVS